MAAIVGVPTIMIDTQMRIVLLRAQSANMPLSGTLAMALVEVCLRTGKSFHIKHKIKHAKAKSELPSVIAVAGARRSGLFARRTTTLGPSASAAASEPLSSPPDPKAEFEIWRLRLLHCHAAEVYIDMFAEYVALGCSYVIVSFCWDHPKFLLSRYQDMEENETQSLGCIQNQSLSKLLGGSHVILVVWQLGAEIIVDYISCLLEIGINFQPLQRQAFFLAALLIWATTGNVAISSNVFLQV
ncbi:hypothetical protein Gpo141_00011587 [Globisporangium polare]